jgi:hypothetical protein
MRTYRPKFERQVEKAVDCIGRLSTALHLDGEKEKQSWRKILTETISLVHAYEQFNRDPNVQKAKEETLELVKCQSESLASSIAAEEACSRALQEVITLTQKLNSFTEQYIALYQTARDIYVTLVERGVIEPRRIN